MPIRIELKGKRRQVLEEHADDARLSKELATMNDEVPVEITEATARVHHPDPEELRRVLGHYEFNTLLRRLEEMDMLGAAPAGDIEQLGLRHLEDSDLVGWLRQQEEAAIAWEERGKHLRAALFAGEGDAVLSTLEPGALAGVLNALLETQEACPRLLCHDYKALLRAAPSLIDCSHDTMVAAYLLKPTAKTYKIEQLAVSAGVRLHVSAERPGEQALATHAAQVFRLAALQRQQLEAEQQLSLFTEVEMPLLRVLSEMERTGIRVDLARLGELAGKVSDQIDQLGDEIRGLCGEGEEFNVDSPQQLAVVLFEKMQMPAGKKTKTGYSTDASVLRKLREAHPVIPKIEQYRELTKLYGTYLKALPEIADPDTWRIHSTFNQTVTATGRISSSNPNLQNIPIRTPMGEKIRDCFVAAPGHKLVAADYSQVELRIMAYLSGENKLLQGFAAGDDVHRDTAAEVFGIPAEEVTAVQRGRAKAVNFGIMYGISGFGLAEQLDIPRDEAAAYIDAYLERYPKVAAFRASVIEQARKDGYVVTVLGRRRPIPELRAGDPNTQRLGERLAVNTVIQGSAADVMKAAMVSAYHALGDQGLSARLVLQVHDELIFEAPLGEVDAVAELARREMAGAWQHDPPLVVDVGVGDTWLEAK